MLSSLSKSRIVTSEVFRTNRWSCVHRSTTPLFAFCVRSPFIFLITHPNLFSAHSPFTHRALCNRSSFVQTALTVHSWFIGESREFQGLLYTQNENKNQKMTNKHLFFYFLAKHRFTSIVYEKLSHRVVYLSCITNGISPYLKLFNIRS